MAIHTSISISMWATEAEGLLVVIRRSPNIKVTDISEANHKVISRNELTNFSAYELDVKEHQCDGR
jgi:hypothetical protein